MLEKHVHLVYYITFIKPVIGYGLWIYGCTLKNRLKLDLLLQKKLWQLCFKARHHSSTEMFIEIILLPVYEFHAVEFLIFFVFQFVVFYPLNSSTQYMTAKNLMFHPAKLNLTYFLCHMNPALLAVILCVTELQSWVIAWLNTGLGTVVSSIRTKRKT